MPSTFVYDPIYAPLLTSLCLSAGVSLCLTVCDSSFVFPSDTEKSNCENTNLVLSVISVITVLVKLLYMVRGCVTRFAVDKSVCLSLPVCLPGVPVVRGS